MELPRVTLGLIFESVRKLTLQSQKFRKIELVPQKKVTFRVKLMLQQS